MISAESSSSCDLAVEVDIMDPEYYRMCDKVEALMAENAKLRAESEKLRDFGTSVGADLRDARLQNGEMKKLLRAIGEPIFAADEKADPDKHTFCVCMYCAAWAIYEDQPTETRTRDGGA